MASPSESWMQEFNEASKLGDEISDMIFGKNSLPQSGPETQRHLSATRRKTTILRTRLDTLQSLLSALPSKQSISGKEINRRQEMLKNLSTKVNQMSTALNMAGDASRENLLGSDSKTDDIINRASGLDNQGLVEQDEGLENLEETVTSTKHIALAVNEELTLHTRLLVGAVDVFPIYSIFYLAFNTIFPSLLYSGWLRRACGCNKFSYAGFKGIWLF
uniref:Uncharacterized protein n=1 Tax=Salix viminalis TaxID=40686 RepID=A0A6N2KU36_SALVM